MTKKSFKQERRLKLDKESQDCMRKQLEAFREKFGRDPDPEDPVFFGPRSDVPRPMDLADFDAEVVEVMCEAGIRPELIHAYIRTGLIVAQENRKYLSKEDRMAWDRAILEYFERIETPGKHQRKQDEFGSNSEPIRYRRATGPHTHRRRSAIDPEGDLS
jgi:hypothetical protein